MSREIKFRVWHKPEKKMHSYLKAKFGKATNITLEGKFRDVEQVTTKTVPNGALEVMQYTGLKDKKRTPEYPEGQEIFEGDVVSYRNRGNKPVGFLKGEFVLLNENGDFYDSVGAAHEECEVIGDIYSNPDLLK